MAVCVRWTVSIPLEPFHDTSWRFCAARNDERNHRLCVQRHFPSQSLHYPQIKCALWLETCTNLSLGPFCPAVFSCGPRDVACPLSAVPTQYVCNIMSCYMYHFWHEWRFTLIKNGYLFMFNSHFDPWRAFRPNYRHKNHIVSKPVKKYHCSSLLLTLPCGTGQVSSGRLLAHLT